MLTVTAHDVTDAYKETLMRLAVHGAEEPSRNGRVLTLQQPFGLTILHPEKRVLFDPARNANPFFHVMEFVWMMTGSDQAEWIKQFNSRMLEYANGSTLRGAYGHRWRTLNGDQIWWAIERLRNDPTTRQAVLAMWDPEFDNRAGSRDYPCNTHIYLRIVDRKVEMTVCNRSNDVVWGMLGANVVHMTFLQELIANELGRPVGRYHVLTNNAHIYEHHYDLMHGRYAVEQVGYEVGVPLLDGESYRQFVEGCAHFVAGRPTGVYWLNYVALPIQKAWECRNDVPMALAHARKIRDVNWRRACIEWLERKSKRIAERGKFGDTTQS